MVFRELGSRVLRLRMKGSRFRLWDLGFLQRVLGFWVFGEGFGNLGASSS